MDAVSINVVPECGGCGECDACAGPPVAPWGWAAGDFEDYTVSTIALQSREDIARKRTRVSDDDCPGFAWLVLIILITTAAMALLHEPTAEAA